MGSKTLKRLLTSLLSLSLLCTQYVAMPVVAEGNEPASLTEGQVILNNYDGPALTDAEKNVMLNENIDSNKLTYVAPTDSDGLVTLDGNTVKAKEHTDAEGNLWVPVSAVLKEDGEPDVVIDLATGAIDPKTNSYSVEVVYETYTTVSAERQTKMLNVAHYLTEGIASVETLVNGSNSLSVFNEPVELLGETKSVIRLFYDYFVVGQEFYPFEGLSVSTSLKLDNPESEAAVAAITKLFEDWSNGNYSLLVGGEFDLVSESGLYNGSYKGVQEVSFLQEKAGTMKVMASTIKELSEEIYNCTEMKEMISTIKQFYPLVGDALLGYVNRIGAVVEDETTSVVEAMDKGLNDNWTILNMLDMIPAPYTSTLNDAVLAAKGNTVGGYVVANETLKLAGATVVVSQARNNVKITITGKAYKNNVEVPLNHVITLRLATGTSMAEIDGKVATAVQEYIDANWAEYELNNDNYDVTWSYADYGTLTYDVDYDINYEPYMYEVTGVLAGTYPYGWVLTLPSGAAEEKLYTYTVNGVPMQENDTVKVTEDLQITRVEQAKKRVLSLLVTDLGLETESIEAKVLNNAAVKSDYVSYDVPKSADDLLSLTFNEGVYTLTAQECELSGTGMKWVPFEYYVGDTAYPFNGVYTVEINDSSITNVKVDYKLQLTQYMGGTITPAYAAERANLPYSLWTLTKNQSSALHSLKSMLEENKSDLGLIPTALGMLRTNIRAPYDTNGDGFPDSALSAYDQDVVNKIGVILTDCFVTVDAVQMLSVAHYASFYKTDADMVYYYDTAENPEYGYYAFIEQLDTLIANLGAVIEHPEFLKLFENEQFKGKDELVTGVIEKLQAKRDDMANYPPSSYIDVTNDSARSLFANLLGAANVSSLTADSVNVHTFFSVKANGYVGVGVKVVAKGHDGAEIGSQVSAGDLFTLSLVNGDKFTQDKINQINTEITALLNKVLTSDVQKVFEQVSIENMPAVDSVPSEDVEVVVTYAPKAVTVNVEGAAPQTIVYGSTKIELPVSTTPGEYYEYDVMGQTVTTSTYTFTEAELVQIVEAGGLTITRTVVNVNNNNMKDLVESLNSGMTGESRFILLEKDGEHQIVLRLAASELANAMNMVTGAAQGLATSAYDFVAIGEDSLDYAFWGTWNETQLISIQGLINGVLASGLSIDSILEAEPLNPNTFNGYTVVVGANPMARAGIDFGSDLVATKMYLGLKGFAAHSEVPFYITVTGSLTDVQDMLAKVRPYVDVNTENEKVNVVVNLPDRIYQVLLAGMLVTGYVDLDDVSAVEMDSLVDYITAQFEEAVINGDVSADTYINTLDKLNIDDIDLTAHRDTINKVLKVVRGLYPRFTIGTSTNNTVPATVNGHTKDIIDALGLTAPYDAMLKQENISVNGTLTVSNLGTAYEAVVFDNSEAGLDKIYFAKDLSAVSEGFGANAVVVLLNNVADSVVLGNGIVLDLNGKTIASLTSNNGTTKIFNSAFEADGGVTGAMTGNFNIAGGEYTADVSSMVVAGYSQTNGVVESDLYTAKMVGDKLVIELEADFIEPAREADLKYLAVDLAIQLALNFYTASKLNVDGSDIYAFEYEDVIDTFGGNTDLMNEALHILDYAGLTTFANTLIDDLTDWGALASKVEDGEPLVSYDVTTTPWGVALKHAKAQDYLTVSLKGDASVNEEFTLEIRVMGNPSDSDNVTLAKLLKELENVLTIDAYVELNDLSYTNEDGFTADYMGDGNVTIDFTQAPNGEHYTTLMGLILAYANPSIKPAVQNYIDNGDVDGLIAAVDGLSVANVISAIKGIRGVSFAKLSNGYAASDVAYLESIYHVFLQGIAGVMNKLDVTGRDTKIGGLTTTKGVYVIDKAWKNISGTVTLKLFAEKAPELEPYAYVNTNILGWEIDYANKEIRLDFAVTDTTNGLSLSKFGEDFYVGFDVNSGVVQSTTFDQKTIEAGLIRNGSVVVVKYGKTATSTPIEETWTIKVVGDVNGNGLIESNDAALIAKTFVDSNFTLNAIQEWAADVNGEYGLDSNDALLNAYKWTMQTNRYTSKLRNVEEGK